MSPPSYQMVVLLSHLGMDKEEESKVEGAMTHILEYWGDGLEQDDVQVRRAEGWTATRC